MADLSGGKVGLIIGEQVRSYDASVTFTLLATGSVAFVDGGTWDVGAWDQATWAA